jgi:hypothetical protein
MHDKQEDKSHILTHHHKLNAIDIGVLPEARMEEVSSEPSLCYPYLQNVPQIVDLQSKESAFGTHTMVSNNEDMTFHTRFALDCAQHCKRKTVLQAQVL